MLCLALRSEPLVFGQHGLHALGAFADLFVCLLVLSIAQVVDLVLANTPTWYNGGQVRWLSQVELSVR